MPSSDARISRWYSVARRATSAESGRPSPPRTRDERATRRKTRFGEDRPGRPRRTPRRRAGPRASMHERQPESPARPTADDQADRPAPARAAGEAQEEHDEGERSATPSSSASEHHGSTPIRSRSGTVAGSTGDEREPGTRPKRTMIADEEDQATHSVPRASGRWPMEVRAGRQRAPEDLLGHAEHVDRGEEACRATAGKSHQRDGPTARRRGTSGSRRRTPRWPGSPSDERPPSVKHVAMPGHHAAEAAHLKISRVWAFS